MLSALHETDDRTPRRTRRRATLTCEIHKHFQLFADDMVGARVNGHQELTHLGHEELTHPGVPGRVALTQ